MPELNTEEFIHASNLDNRHRGQLAEIAFVRKSTSLGFAVAKPWGEGERYDFIVRVNSVCWRVQVKSVLAKAPNRPHYRLHTAGGRRQTATLYSADEIDFLVAYLFQQDTWYVFPARAIENRPMIYLRPGSKRSRFEPYREAWDLMRPSTPDPLPEPAATAAPDQTDSPAALAPPGSAAGT